MAEDWWELHLRVCCGEVLTEDERALYERELARIESVAMPLNNIAELIKLRDETEELEAKRADLIRRRRKLNAKIATLEKALSGRNKELLGVKG